LNHGVNQASSIDFAASLARQLEGETESLGLPWWETRTAAVLVDVARSRSLIVVLGGIAEVLQEGLDPLWVVGDQDPKAAFEVALEWLAAGVEPSEVAGWLRAGCWDPRAARRMADAGIRVSELLDEAGRPRYPVDIGPDGELPLALAVADTYLSVEDAARLVHGEPAAAG
jgi:hypothetical protein